MKSRRGIELINRMASLKLTEDGQGHLADRIAPYRAGYTPQQRRQIEADLAEGRLLAVAATDALELGIDIGELDAAVCVNFPGTVASLRQMWGRAGTAAPRARRLHRRPGRPRPVLLPPPRRVPGPAGRGRDPRPRLRADPDAAPRRRRLRAPARPRGRRRSWARAGASPPSAWSRWASCASARGDRYMSRTGDFVAGRISLRSASADSLAVVDRTSGEMIGHVDAARAFSTVHPGAVYLHLGRSYEVIDMDLDARRAMVKPFDGDYYTQAKKETEVFIDDTDVQRVDARGRAQLRVGRGLRAGDRLPAQAPRRQRGARDRARSTCPSRTSSPRPSGTWSASEWSPGCRWRCCSAPCTPPSTARSRSCP